MKSWWLVGLFCLAGVLCACGGGGGGSSSSSSPSVSSPPPAAASNVQPVSVNLGPEGNYVNGLFTSVTVCIPGTSSCQTVNDILVDTGSSGLRILASALTLGLPGQTDAGGNSIGECAQFVKSFTWGPVVTASVRMAGESAANVPVQLIGPASFPGPPANCPNGLPPADTVSALGANGILGIGIFVPDCGSACASSGPSNPGFYYSCSSSGCVVTTANPQNQVQNPVASFSSDNNGVLIQLPAVGAQGAATASGSLIFGIGTQSDNGLGAAQVYTTDGLGNFTTIFEGTSYSSSFIDSGSNGLFFLSSGVTGIAQCTGGIAAFYCPPNTVSLAARNVGQNGTSGTVAISIANAQKLFSSGNAAYSNLGGPNPGAFDWGAPFFFGRNVFVAIDGAPTPAGAGPYWAY
jgi:Protein of unknown function (DUF3443)